MMGRSPGFQAGGWGVGPQRLPHGWGWYPDKAIPNTAWLQLFFGHEMEDRVKCEMYGGPTTCWEHWAQLGGCGLSAAAWQLLPAHYREHSLSGWILAIAPPAAAEAAAAAQPSCNARGRVCFAFAKNYCAMEGSV